MLDRQAALLNQVVEEAAAANVAFASTFEVKAAWPHNPLYVPCRAQFLP